MITEKDLKGIAARAALASPGLWELGKITVREDSVGHKIGDSWIVVGIPDLPPGRGGNVVAACGLAGDENEDQSLLDALFFCHAREDIAKLIEEVKRLQGVEKELREALATTP